MAVENGTRDKFLKWLDEELAQRGWSLRELGRRANIAISNVSNIRKGTRAVTYDYVAAIADGFGMRHEDAFRRVGLLPDNQTCLDELQEILNYLPEDQREEVIKYAEWKRKEHV